jgi:hypothetical protein
MDCYQIASIIISVVVCVIIAIQAIILLKQTSISKKIDESNKIMTMSTRYADLSDKRKIFWESLRHLYSQSFRDYICKNELGPAPESVDSLIQDAIFPPDFSPKKERDLLRFIETHEKYWKGKNFIVWDLAQFAHDIHPDQLLQQSKKNMSRHWLNQFPEAQHDLAYFWNTWHKILDVRKCVTPNPKELVILTWLEFALVKQTRDSGIPGKTSLFELAKDEHESFHS